MKEVMHVVLNGFGILLAGLSLLLVLAGMSLSLVSIASEAKHLRYSRQRRRHL
jgi:hypothetical protein